MLVGEIRDLETAENAIQLRLTGHLVFSTPHSTTPPALHAAFHMGVEPFLVASTVEGVMGQRLVRRLCTPQAEIRTGQGRAADPFPWDKMTGPIYSPSAAANAAIPVIASRALTW